jgi:hypothetical protein
MYRMLAILMASFGIAVAAVPTDRGMIPAGTIIRVRTNEFIDADNAAPGRAFTGVVQESAKDRHGNVIIPKGSLAQLVVRDAGKHHVTLDLASITAGGKTYAVSSSGETITGSKKPGVGKNKRTAKFLGGGAAAGGVIGAIAGGGVGALVGGAVGAGGGAAAQQLTRKKSVRVPSESLLTFQLQRPLVTR